MRIAALALTVLLIGNAEARMQAYWTCTGANGQKTAQDYPCPAPIAAKPEPDQVQPPVEPPAPTQAEVQEPKVQQQTIPKAPHRPAKPVAATKASKSFASLFWMVILGLLAVFALKTWLVPSRTRTPRHGSHKSQNPFDRIEPSSDLLNTGWSRKASPVLVPERPTEWSIELIRKLEWKRFEELCAGCWRAKNHRAELTCTGPDGGVDINIYSPSEPERLLAIVQCKALSEPVGVEKVRALWGVASHLGVKLAIFYGLSGYTSQAKEFAIGKHLKLFTGEDLLSQVLSLSADQQNDLLQDITRGDYTTPTCARCDVKMVWRENAKFWGCVNYPSCTSKIYSKQPLTA